MVDLVFIFYSFHKFNKEIDLSIKTSGEDLKGLHIGYFLSEFQGSYLLVFYT